MAQQSGILAALTENQVLNTPMTSQTPDISRSSGHTTPFPRAPEHTLTH